jgi:predicted TIM-barrel fold metal-dependent hydrolase
MKTVDCQLHEPIVWLDWDGADASSRRQLLTELQLAYMTAVGIDCAVLFPVDLGWGEEAAARFPDRFAVVRMITPEGVLDGLDPLDPDIDALVAEEIRKPATLGLRILPAHLPPDGSGYALLDDGFYDRVLELCEEGGLPVFMSTMGNLSAPALVADRFPGLTIVIDHFGMLQPPTCERDSPPLRALPELIALARYPNVAVKFSGGPTLSEQSYPFDDLWPHLEQVVAAFGADRLLWGSDISRVWGRIGFREVKLPYGENDYPGKHTYAEALHYVRDTDRLSERDKEWLLGGTASKLLGWPAA